MTGAPALPPMDVGARSIVLREQLPALGCDVFVVTHLTNIRYLTGFTGSSAVLVVGPGGLLLITDGRYEEQAASELAAAGVDARIQIVRTLADQQAAVATAVEGAARVGLEADHVTWAQQQAHAAALPGQELVAVRDAVEDLRATKDPGEVARLEAAAAIADRALASVAPLLHEGPSEVGFALALDTEVRRAGADDVSFETIVASGPNGSRPHHRPGDRTIGPGDLVVIDFGAMVDGYHSDMTRTIPVGGVEALGETERRMLEVVTAAQQAGVEAVVAGAPVAQVDAACREAIADAGWADAFVHGTGHGVGLDIHEAPSVNGSSAATLRAGHVVTVEPGVYLPGTGGVRVEDTVLVTADGPRTLTRAPKH